MRNHAETFSKVNKWQWCSVHRDRSVSPGVLSRNLSRNTEHHTQNKTIIIQLITINFFFHCQNFLPRSVSTWPGLVGESDALHRRVIQCGFSRSVWMLIRSVLLTCCKCCVTGNMDFHRAAEISTQWKPPLDYSTSTTSTSTSTSTSTAKCVTQQVTAHTHTSNTLISS